MNKTPKTVQCIVCNREHTLHRTVAAAMIRDSVGERLRRAAPEPWPPKARVCLGCLNDSRAAFLREQLEVERGELSALETEVSRKAAEHTAIAAHIDEAFVRELTLGERLADKVASIGGSWPFVIAFGAVLAVWIGVNSWFLGKEAFDPYPYILLNLALSCLAAVQAPIIMMSQKRSAARDRFQADEDYRINLKAELEVGGLHEKIDHLLHVQWERMVEIQQTQLELLTDIASRVR